MLDLKGIGEAPEFVRERLARRGDPSLPELVDRVLVLDEERRGHIAQVDELRARRNEVSPRVAELKKAGRDEEAQALILEMRELGAALDAEEARLGEVEEALRTLLLQIPNLPEADVPAGGEEANRVLREWGEAPAFDFEPRPHWE